MDNDPKYDPRNDPQSAQYVDPDDAPATRETFGDYLIVLRLILRRILIYIFSVKLPGRLNTGNRRP